MTKYRIIDRNSGATMEVTGDHPPSEKEIDGLFRLSQAPGKAEGPEEGKREPGQKQQAGERASLEEKKQAVPLKKEETRKAIAEAGTGDEEKQDVLLDVPTLNIDEIKLNVDGLDAQLALRAELANLLRISVGADVGIKKVDLDIKGVEAQAVLRARLKQVANILSRALDTIDRNPELLIKLLQPISQAVGETGKEAGKQAGNLAQQGGTKAGEMTETAKGVTAQKGPVAEAVKGASQGADRSVRGHAESREEKRRHFEKQEKNAERERDLAEAKK